MSRLVRSGGVALMVAALVAVAGAQQPPANRPDEAVATVNGVSITKADVLNHLSYFSFPPGKEKEVYDEALDYLINVELLKQFLRDQRVAVSKEEIDAEINRISQEHGDLASALAAANTTSVELRRRRELILQWKKYVAAQATTAALKKFVTDNQDEFNGTRVRASHILVKVDPGAPAAEQEQAKQKLLAIKKEIEGGQITFAAAADKYSEDDGNVATKAGGDLGEFTRSGQFIEEFSAAAFALKPGAISDPVKTPFGYHLIVVTDRKEGTPINFDQYRDRILELFGFDLQNRILAAQRPKAKIDKKPMPADFLPPVATPAPAAER